MIVEKKDSITLQKFEIFAQHAIAHGCIERQGGVSQGPFSSLNLSAYCGDNLEDIKENRIRLSKTFGFRNPIYLKQVHSTTIHTIKEPHQDLLVGDGMITSCKGVELIIQHADCQALLLFDPVLQVIGAAHVGWRGNVDHMIHAIVKRMQNEFSSYPSNLLAAISPALGPMHAQFLNAKEEFPPDFFQFQWKKDYFNLWEISKKQLLDVGLLEHHIQIAAICTYSHPDQFFSYRRDRETGRNASFIALSPMQYKGKELAHNPS